MDPVFAASRPVWLRTMTLHHVVTAATVLFALRRFGYDPRAFRLQTRLGSVLLLAGYFFADPWVRTDDVLVSSGAGVSFDPDYDINWSHGLGGRPEEGTFPMALLFMLVGYPIAVHLPTHFVLRRVFDTEATR